MSQTVQTELVYVKQSHKGHSYYHTNPDCHYLQRASGYRTIDKQLIPNYTLCRECDPDTEINHASNQNKSHWKHSVCECGRETHGDRCGFCERYDTVHAQPRELSVYWFPVWWETPVYYRFTRSESKQ